MAKSSISIFHRPIPSRPSSLLTQMFCPYIQCLQSSRSHVGGSNLDFCVEEKFQMTLNPWTGRSQLLPETFKFELRPVWWGAGTERHSPPPSLLAKQLLKEFVRFPISCISLLWKIDISRLKQCCISYCHLCKLNCCELALQELLMAMSRWICLFLNSISKFPNLSFFKNENFIPPFLERRH